MDRTRRPRARRRIRSLLVLVVAVAVATAVTGAAGVAAASPSAAARNSHVAADAGVITEWNAIAERTIFTEAGTPIPPSALYFGFVSAAVYNAVVTIEGRYQPYTPQPRPHGRAATDAAAATAAYRVLSHYFPASASALAADYATSLARVRPGVAKDRGIRVGEAAAGAVIRLRENDGRNAPVSLTVDPAPGVWRPTPPALAPMLAPWLGFVTPMLLTSPTQVPLPGPDALTSRAYTRDFREVKNYGGLTGSRRSPAQTETALFFNSNAVAQYQQGLRDQAERRRLDIVDSARMFAILSTTTADALIACWRSKYDYAYWRPITAIQLADTDGNPRTMPDPGWTPLVPTPPYPEYVSGHACITGATSHGLSYLFGADRIRLRIASSVTGTSRRYLTASSLDRDTMNARIWLGLHFRKAMTDGNQLGHDVSDYGVRHFFRPAR